MFGMYTLNVIYKMVFIGGGERCSDNELPFYKGQNWLIFLTEGCGLVQVIQDRLYPF